jgi:hypothetical protein
MTRGTVGVLLVALGAGACLSLDADELRDDVFDASAASRGSGAGGSKSWPDAGRIGSGASGGQAGTGGASGAGGGNGGATAGGPPAGTAGGPPASGGAAGGTKDAGRAGSAGASGSGQGGAVAGDGGARVCKGGVTGMCPTPYSVAGTVDDLCKAYCDCMSGPCSGNMPANCLATCKSQIDKWDICCRLNKCFTRPCDYKDQFIGDCKAAAGIQACLDKG